MAHEETSLAGKEVRVEMRLKNNRLWNLIFSRWDSVNAFCQEISLSGTVVGNLLNLKRHPINAKKGTYCSPCQKIAEFFKMLPEDIFPLEIYELEQTEGSSELGVEEIPYHQCVLLPAPDVIDATIVEIGNKQLIEKFLTILRPRERMFVEMKFGLGEHSEHTADEIADKVGITGARADQIIRKAISRIRSNPKARQAFHAFATGNPCNVVFAPREDIEQARSYINALEKAIVDYINLQYSRRYDASARMLTQWFGVFGYRERTLEDIVRTVDMRQYLPTPPAKVIADAILVMTINPSVRDILRRDDAERIMHMASQYPALCQYKQRIQKMFWSHHR